MTMRKAVRATVLGSSALVASSLLTPAGAVEWSAGDWFGSFDTTLTIGAQFRVADRDDKTIGWANGGTRYSINGDDGNLNYDPGLISLAGRATHEFEANYEAFRLFLRGTYFVDIVNLDSDSTEFRDLSDAAQDQVSRDAELLDAFIAYGFEAGEVPIDFKIGNVVLSWGESTFIQNGVNVINPVDVGALRVPGSELRDALTPVPLANLSIGLTENLSVEGFYQFQWKETEIDAAGTYFSTNDFAAPGGQAVFLGFGLGGANPGKPNFDGSFGIPDDPATALALPNGFYGEASLGAVAPRDPDHDASDQGQFGIALRYFAPALHDTEFGAYYINYHSRTPLISSRVGSLTDVLGITAPNFTAGSRYFIEYPEDISLFGLSFNTLLPFGTSLQGEVTYRQDQPLQLDDVEILQATLAPAAVRASGAQGAAAGAAAGEAQARATPGFDQLPPEQQQQLIAQTAAAFAAGGELQGATQAAQLFGQNQIIRDLGGIAIDPTNVQNTYASSDRFFDQTLNGYRSFDVWQFQTTATHAFGPISGWGVNQWVLVGEVGVTHVADLPSKDVLLFEGPNTPLPGTRTGALISAPFVPVQPGGFADATSWGYRLAARFDMLNAIGPINLFPSISFSHDVNGTTPTPISNFIEDRAAVSVGLRGTYLEQITAEIQYTNFFSLGDDEFNLLNDRDFVTISIKYAF